MSNYMRTGLNKGEITSIPLSPQGRKNFDGINWGKKPVKNIHSNKKCPQCGSDLAPGAPQDEGRKSSYRCFKCDKKFVL